MSNFFINSNSDEPSPGLSLKGRGILVVCFFLGALFQNVRAEDAKPQVERKPVELTEAARRLHSSSLVIDGHNDMPWEIRKQGSSSFDKMDISHPQKTLQT